MALIKCYECSKQISDLAPYCVHCGAGFGQSALYSYLYDDDAVSVAEPNALKEAMIGGETGAVADVLMSMAGVGRRGIRRHQAQRVTDIIEKEVARAWVDMKELDKKSFTDRVTSTDPNDQAFIEGVMDGSILASAQDASKAVQDAIRADPDSTPQVRDQKLYAEVKRITSVFREMEVMKVGVQAIRSGNIASDVSPPVEAVDARSPDEFQGIDQGSQTQQEPSLISEKQPPELEEPTLSTQKHSKSSQEAAVDPNETISGMELLMRLSQADLDKLVSLLGKGELPIEQGSKTQQEPSPASEKPPSP